MKVACLTCAVSDPNGFKSDVLELLQAAMFCDFGVQTKAAQFFVAMFDRPIVGDIVTGRRNCAPIT